LLAYFSYPEDGGDTSFRNMGSNSIHTARHIFLARLFFLPWR
jgi:hypothetical protein